MSIYATLTIDKAIPVPPASLGADLPFDLYYEAALLQEIAYYEACALYAMRDYFYTNWTEVDALLHERQLRIDALARRGSDYALPMFTVNRPSDAML